MRGVRRGARELLDAELGERAGLRGLARETLGPEGDDGVASGNEIEVALDGHTAVGADVEGEIPCPRQFSLLFVDRVHPGPRLGVSAVLVVDEEQLVVTE